MTRSFGETAQVEFPEQGLKKRVRSRVVGVSKGGPGYRLHAKMVEAVSCSVHAHDSIPKAFAPGQLGVQQVDELTPPGKSPRRALRSMLLR